MYLFTYIKDVMNQAGLPRAGTGDVAPHVTGALIQRSTGRSGPGRSESAQGLVPRDPGITAARRATACPLLLSLLLSSGVMAADGPWRLNDALSLPKALSLSGTYRLRYESLEDQFRAGRNGGDQVLVQRLTLLGTVRTGRFTFGGELLDARAWLNDSGSPVNTTIVNTWELLQGYAEIDLAGVFGADRKSTLRLGRITMDVGSRRLVARNRYRNTINGFTGADWQLQGAGGWSLRAFYTLPVNRLPSQAAALLDNDAKFDDEDFDTRFWGVYFAPATLPWGDKGELYLFGLNERDSGDLQTRNRDLLTPGLRLYRPARSGRFDYLVESVLQFGESRAATAVTDTIDLDHFAHFHHLELGYSFAAAWSPRLLLQYDYASGDGNPLDDDNGRFDTLFGARRFDFGPTGIYGAFARGNLSSPALRLELKPDGKFDAMLAWRGFWLASTQDAWTTSGVVDTSGGSGRYIGQQIEIRLRWNVVPGNIALETGAAHLFRGRFMRDAPNANGEGDPGYLYTQLVFTF